MIGQFSNGVFEVHPLSVARVSVCVCVGQPRGAAAFVEASLVEGAGGVCIVVERVGVRSRSSTSFGIFQ